MSEKYKILTEFAKDISFETPDIETKDLGFELESPDKSEKDKN